MSKEWLEDKKNQLKNATVFINENGNEAVEISIKVINKIIEQAERVQELEQKIRVDSELFEKQVQQNKRYLEAIDVAMNYVLKGKSDKANKLFSYFKEVLEE